MDNWINEDRIKDSIDRIEQPSEPDYDRWYRERQEKELREIDDEMERIFDIR